MGGIVSPGVDNDDLIDKLIQARYIRSDLVEKVFRYVDRAFYFSPEFRGAAYRDQAWKHGNLHLSAPCIYSEVLEQLNLQMGQSFLNIGSGTGYLSTMVGLILGPYGVNHGIEIHADVVDYAYEKLEKFKSSFNIVDVFEFCEPQFVIGNAFDLNPECQYDRIYCGAACPEAYHERIKRYMKVGGILVVPCEDDLLKIKRTGPDMWEKTSVLQVSFSTLSLPKDKTSNSTFYLNSSPQCLQALCRTHIRSLLRQVVEIENPELRILCHRRVNLKESRKSQNRCSDNRLIIPIFENGGGYEQSSHVGTSNSGSGVGRLNFGQLIFHNYSTASFRTFVRNLAGGDDDDDDEDDVDVETRDIRDNEHEGKATENTATNTGTENATNATNGTNKDVANVKSEAKNGGVRAPKRQLASKSDIREDHLKSDERSEPSTCPISVKDRRRRRLLQMDRSMSSEKRRLSRAVKCTVLSGDDERPTPENERRHQVTESRNETKGQRTAKYVAGSKTGASENEQVDEQKRKNESIRSQNSGKEGNNENGRLLCERGTVAVKEDEDSNGGHPKKLFKPDRLANEMSDGGNGRNREIDRESFSASTSLFDEPMEVIDETENLSTQIDKVANKKWCNTEVDKPNHDDQNKKHKQDKEQNEKGDHDLTKENNDDESVDDDEDEDDNEDEEEREENNDSDAAFEETTLRDTQSMKYRTVMEKKILALPLPQSIKTYLNYDRAFVFSC